MFSFWSLSDCKSIFSILLSILADLNNTIVWMVSDPLIISMFPSPCINPLVTVPRAPITIGVIVTFMFHSFFFNSLLRLRYLSFFFTFFQYYSVVNRDCNVPNTASSLVFLLLIIIRSGNFPVFLSSPLVLWSPLPIFSSTFDFPFNPTILILSWVGSSIPSVICRFILSITCMAYFL